MSYLHLRDCYKLLLSEEECNLELRDEFVETYNWFWENEVTFKRVQLYACYLTNKGSL